MCGVPLVSLMRGDTFEYRPRLINVLRVVLTLMKYISEFILRWSEIPHDGLKYILTWGALQLPYAISEMVWTPLFVTSWFVEG